MRRAGRRRAPFAAIAVLAVVAGAFASVPMQAADAGRARVDTLAAGYALLAAGRNDEAAALFLREARRRPTGLESADGFVSALSRACRYDDAAERLRELASRANVLDRFLSGCDLRHEQAFEQAALAFRGAAIAAAGADDGISAFTAWRAAARALVGARDAAGAMMVLGRADSLLAALANGQPEFARIAPALGADLLTTAGEAYDLVDRLDEADSIYALALGTAEDLGLERVRAAALNGRARVREKRQLATEAASLYRSALRIERRLGDRRLVAALLNNLGQTAIRLGDRAEGRARLEEALAISRECGLDWMLGYVFYGLGAIAEAEGDRAAAIDRFRQSTDSHREAGNTWGEYGSRMRLGYNLAMAGEYGEAVVHYEACVGHYEEIHSLYGLSWAVGGLALAYHRLGDFVAAERRYREALDVKLRLGDRAGAAWALNSIGMVFDLQGRYTEALAAEHEAMRLYGELGDRAGVGAVRFSMGSVRFYLGDYNEALAQYEEARAAALETGDDDLLQLVMSGIGSVYTAAKRPDLAGPVYRRFLDAARGSGDHARLLYALVNLASHLVETGDRAAARGYLDEAFRLLPDRGQAYIRARVLALIGDTEADPRDGIQRKTEALALARAAGIRDLEWKTLSAIGDLYLAAADSAGAHARQEEAVEALEALGRSVTAAELRTHLLSQAILPYERAIALRFAGGDEAAAFVLAERSRAQALFAMLRRAFTRAAAGQAPAEEAAERPFRSRLAFLQARLQEPALGDGERRAYLAEIDSLELRLERVRLDRAPDDDLFAAADPAGVGLNKLLAVLRPGERLLSYMLGDDESWLFTAADGAVAVRMLPPRREIEERVRVFLGLYAADSTVAPVPDEVVTAAEKEIFDLLVGPVADGMAPGERLVIVPDGLLHRLPFSLLRNHDRRLCDDHEIFFTPSLRVLGMLRRRDAGVRRRQLDMIAVGSGGASASGRVYPFTNVSVEPLPHAGEEASAVAAMFGRSVVLVGGDAEEGRFKDAFRRDAAMIHIASHSSVDDIDPRRSFIVLAPERADSTTEGGEDGILQWHEIASLSAGPALVVLSACRSAGGVIATGEGVMGLTQAFLHAGAACVLASRVDIPDRFASRFMTAFYRKLGEGGDAAGALGAAQREMAGAAVDPALWSGFVLVGDGAVAPVARRGIGASFIVVAALVAAGALFLVARRRSV